MGVQNPLTAVMTLKPVDGNYDPKRELEQLLVSQGHVVVGIVQRLGFLHFARFVFFEVGGQTKFAIITTYDFDFEDYINIFIDELGSVFDEMLRHIEGTDKLTPVRQHRQEFINFVRTVDVTSPAVFANSLKPEDKRDPKLGVALFFSAYPNLSVQQIWKMEKETYA